MLILTRLGSREILGLISPRSLFDTLRVFSCLSSIIEVGKSYNLLLCKSKTVRLGALSRFDRDSKKLKERAKVSSFFELGILSKDVI